MVSKHSSLLQWLLVRQPRLGVAAALLIGLLHFLGIAEAKHDGETFLCGGEVEAEVWQIWDRSVAESMRTEELDIRLGTKGDVYAIYDVQKYVHNLVAMARRCRRSERLEELAKLLVVAYAALDRHREGKPRAAWICTGGGICNDRNGLLNKEVMLNSVQFLALTMSLASALATSREEFRGGFVTRTLAITIQHLLRWGDEAEQERLGRMIFAQPVDVRNGSSVLFFHDKHLWMLSIYADLAGILRRWPDALSHAGFSDGDTQRLSQHARQLLRLFLARTTLTRRVNGTGQLVVLADLDRGFWRLYPDSRYANYSGDDKPVVCVVMPDSTLRFEIMHHAPKIEAESDIGWDFDHARRLVHALDALERNRVAMHSVLGVEEALQVSQRLLTAFAQQLVERIWNGDVGAPLFSNYWSGTNGWYRVAYDNGTGRCMEGYPPFGLSESFATGGYITWGRYVPVIGQLGRRLFRLSGSSDPDHQRFLDRYYRGLSGRAGERTRNLTKIMFLPSLVTVEKYE